MDPAADPRGIADGLGAVHREGERAIAAAQKNASRLNLAGAKFIAMKAADTAQFLIRAGYRAQTVMLDPPRTGAADLMEAIEGEIRSRAGIGGAVAADDESTEE